jgi:AcrR family transcriptional regulator
MMKNEKHDRRSERTRRLLGEALTSLMLERRYVDLTVQDILDRANVGRSTFYAHFWDKEDLLTSQIEGMLDTLIRQMQETPVARDDLFPSLGLLRHVQEYYRVYQAQVRSGGMDPVFHTFHLRLCEYVETRLRAQGCAPDLSVTMTAQAVVGAFLALLHWWLQHEMPLSPEELDAYFHQLVMPGVRAVVIR